MTREKVLDPRQSATIDAMRFLLIVLVLFIHMLPPELQPVTTELTAKNVYVFVTEMISHNLGAMAVPAFFVLSGYFFFLPLDGSLSFSWLGERWKKRTRTLLIPYLFWNLFMILAICVKNGVFTLVGFGVGDEFDMVRRMDVINWLWTGPADYPLWYLRDLICMTVVAPVFYLLCKYLRALAPILLIAFYLSGLSIPVTGFGSTAITFFGIGAFLGFNKLNIVGLCSKVKWPSIISAIVLLVIATINNAAPVHAVLERVFVLVAIVACINFVDSFKDDTVLKLSSLSAAVFFVYAAHEVYILGWCNGAFMRVFGTTVCSCSIRYFVEPFVVLLLCLGLFWLLKKIMPRTLGFACGGRVNK